MAQTSRWGLHYPEGTDAPDVPKWMKDLALDLDDVAKDDQGLKSARPTSTPESPGKKGRYYFATDEGVLYRDNGTGWDQVSPTRVYPATANTGEGTRTSAEYGAPSDAADKVASVIVPSDALVLVNYSALWKTSGTGVGDAALFIGANQLKVNAGHSADPVVQSAPIQNSGVFENLLTSPVGLLTGKSVTSHNNPPTTGVAQGFAGAAGQDDVLWGDFGGTTLQFGDIAGENAMGGGLLVVGNLAAGTYDFEVKYKSNGSATVTTKQRRLHVAVLGR